MFFRCIKFNQPLNSWNTHKVKNMEAMFYRCTDFNQPTDKWIVNNVECVKSMFVGCGNAHQSFDNWWRDCEAFDCNAYEDLYSND